MPLRNAREAWQVLITRMPLKIVHTESALRLGALPSHPIERYLRQRCREATNTSQMTSHLYDLTWGENIVRLRFGTTPGEVHTHTGNNTPLPLGAQYSSRRSSLPPSCRTRIGKVVNKYRKTVCSGVLLYLDTKSILMTTLRGVWTTPMAR